MADKEKPSIQDILAAARKQDGGGGAAPAAESAPTEAPKPAAKPAAPAKPGKMSVAEMLAAARSGDGGGASAEPAAPAAAKPAAASGAAKKPGQMSVAEMLAAARAEGGGGEAAVKPAPAKKPAAAKAAPVAKEKEPVAEKHSGPKDTASILAAARSGAVKPGPITKAEAAARAAEAGAAAVKKKSAAPPMPSKPDYAKVAPAAAAAAATERRGFLVAATAIFAGTFFLTSSLAIGFSSLAVTTLLWVLGSARFMFPNILTEPPTKFKVGFPDEYAPGQVATKFIAQFGVWVVRYEYNGAPEIYALQSVCTHLGCTPNWLEGEQKFKCPCHGSGFYKDGINFEGPAPRPLERFAIRLADDGQLEVDKSRRFKEEVGQWNDPASFVSV